MRPSFTRLPFPTRTVLAALLLFCPAVAAQAQSRVSTSAAPFLTLGTGARGTALGHAYTALVAGADALFWNPAGAARTYDPGNRSSVFFSHAEWLVDTDYNAFALTIPVTSSGLLGLSLAQLDYGRMAVTTVDLPDGTGETFGASDLVVGMSYAQPLTNTFYIGGTLKYVRQSIYDMKAGAVAFDIGFVLESAYFNGMRLGASIMNFGGQMQMTGVNARKFIDIDPGNTGSSTSLPAELETREWDLPLSFKFGVALPVFQAENVRLDVLSDAHQTNDNGLNADLGSELRFMFGSVNFDLRAGYKDLALTNVDSHLSLGGGLDLRFGGLRFGADFGYVPFEDLGSVSILDLRLYY